MALQLGATRAAFLAAHVPADIADKAAEELAAYETRFATVEGKLSLLTWMVGTNIALTLAIVGRLFLIH